jgi:hypothetical protein
MRIGTESSNSVRAREMWIGGRTGQSRCALEGQFGRLQQINKNGAFR